MARPKYKDSETPARERIIESFWCLLEAMPHHKITVSAITQHAKVNRNTFYYHFETIEDLSICAVQESMRPDLIGALIASMAISDTAPSLPFQELGPERRKIGLVTGNHGSPQLMSVLKSRVRNVWCEIVGIQQGNITDVDDLLIEFALSGMLGVIAPRLATSDDVEKTFRSLFDTGLPSYLVQQLLEIAKRSRGEASS